MEQSLSREELQALRNKRTGVTVFQISWIMVFVCLIVVNLQIRSNFPTWPPAGVAPLEWVLPTIATLGLIASTWFARGALKALEADRLESFLGQWRVTLILAVAFVAIMAFEWITVPESGQYSTLFRVMTAFHGLHALVIGVIMFRVYRTAQAGGYTDANQMWVVEAGAKLWYFVTIAWLMFFTVLYII
jgi:heme/copper-type cytochrome/quinol oxidase subunit 3